VKTAKFETSPGALVALLNARPRAFVWGDLYSFNLVGGGTLRYCTADIDLAYSGTVWPHAGPLIDNERSKSKAHWKRGLDVDTWQVVFAPRNVDPVTGAVYPDQIGNQPWLAAARAGALDGATVLVDRAYLAGWPAFPLPAGGAAPPTGVVNIFTGRVAALDIGRTACVVSVNSHLELLGVAMPRNLFQAGCRFTLFDVGCTLSAASFAEPGVVAAGSTPRTIVNSVNLTPPVFGGGTYALGRVVMTSGQNSGFQRMIRSWDGFKTLTLLAPFYFPLSAGDSFTAYPGCDKSMAACTQFNNLANFGGTPFIPSPETAV
jgi:hypothetical protein